MASVPDSEPRTVGPNRRQRAYQLVDEPESPVTMAYGPVVGVAERGDQPVDPVSGVAEDACYAPFAQAAKDEICNGLAHMHRDTRNRVRQSRVETPGPGPQTRLAA